MVGSTHILSGSERGPPGSTAPIPHFIPAKYAGFRATTLFMQLVFWSWPQARSRNEQARTNPTDKADLYCDWTGSGEWRESCDVLGFFELRRPGARPVELPWRDHKSQLAWHRLVASETAKVLYTVCCSR
jgi:hypothetical protein